MFSVIVILEHFLLLEALRDSKTPYLFSISQCKISSFSKKCLDISLFVIKKLNQLKYHWKIISLHLREIWGKMELRGMNYSPF